MMPLIFFMATVLLPGAAIVSLLRSRIGSGWRGIALAYGIGTALLAFELFLYFVIGRLSFSPLLYWFFGAQSLLSAGIVAYRVSWRQRMQTGSLKFSFLNCVLGGLIGLLMLLSLVQAVANPPVAFDSIAFWAMRAEILLQDGRVDFDRSSPTYLSAYTHQNYPWHLSFQEYWLRQLGGRGGFINIIAWSYFASLILLLADFLTKRLGTWKGLLLTLFCCSQPLLFYHGSNNYADLIIGYYATVGFIFFLEWLEKDRLPLMMAAAAFFSWTICIKNYGIFYIIAFLVGLVLVRVWNIHKLSWRSWRYIGASLAIPLLPLGAFKIFYKLNLRNSEAAWTWHPETMISLGKVLFVSGNWNIWWVIFLVLILLLLPTLYRRNDVLLVWLMFAVIVAIIAVVFMVTENYQWALDQTALSRALIPLVPISIVLIAYSLKASKFFSTKI